MTKREIVFQKYGGKCAYTGKPLGNDWQIDHIEPMQRYSPETEKDKEDYKEYCKYVNRTENLLPALKIVNHYKHSYSIEFFRKLLLTLHRRIAGLYRKDGTIRKGQEKRLYYILKVADAFGITPETPFCGKFYFEREDK